MDSNTYDNLALDLILFLRSEVLMPQDVLSVKPIAVESSVAPQLAPIPVMEQMALEQKQSSGANWFLWIAALSLINSVLILASSSISFPVGLGITQVVDGIALLVIDEYQPASPFIIQVLAFVVDMAIIGVFALFGLFARQKHGWAFIIGMILYLLDSVLVLFFEMWIGVAFHAFALFGLFNGFQATRLYNQYKKAGRLN
jgi:hypothetical protein